MSTIQPNVRTRGQGPTVILLHSSGSSGRQWDSLMQALQSRYRLMATDLHGHGGTAAWPADRPMRMEDEMGLVEPLLHGAGPVHLVGHSYGGALALRLAAVHPGRIASVAVFEPVVFRLLFDSDAKAHVAAQVMLTARSIRSWNDRGRPDRAAQFFVDFWSGEGTWSRMPSAHQDVTAARIPSVIAHFHALFEDDFSRSKLSRLTVPVLCLTGTETTAATSRIGKLLRECLPAATHELMDGMGHMGPITHATYFTARIARFLDALEATANGDAPMLKAA